VSKWQPIKTAPYPSVDILLYADGFYMIGRWNGERSFPYVPADFTHWMPLPAPPQPQTSAAGQERGTPMNPEHSSAALAETGETG
jgi:hypothetical protein